MVPNVGIWEIAIVLIIALVIFGPKRLPELGKSLGRGIREFKGSISGDDDEAKQSRLESAQAPPPGESADAKKADAKKADAKKADEPVVHDRG